MERALLGVVLPKGFKQRLVGAVTMLASVCGIVAFAREYGPAPSILVVLFSVLILAVTIAGWIAYAMHRAWREERAKQKHDSERAWWEEGRRSLAVDLVDAYNRLLLGPPDNADGFETIFVRAKLAWDQFMTPAEREQGNRIPDAWGYIATCYHSKRFSATAELRRAVEHIAHIWPPARNAVLLTLPADSPATTASEEPVLRLSAEVVELPFQSRPDEPTPGITRLERARAGPRFGVVRVENRSGRDIPSLIARVFVEVEPWKGYGAWASDPVEELVPLRLDEGPRLRAGAERLLLLAVIYPRRPEADGQTWYAVREPYSHVDYFNPDLVIHHGTRLGSLVNFCVVFEAEGLRQEVGFRLASDASGPVAKPPLGSAREHVP